MLSEYYDHINSFTYNGVNSLDMNLIITEHSVTAPEPDIELIEVPARGNLIADNRVDELDNQPFSDAEVTYKCCVDATEDFALEELARRIYMWIYSGGTEYQKLYDTYDRDYYSLAYPSGTLSINELARRLLGEADIKFTRKPYKRLIKGDASIILTEATTIHNPEGFTSSPHIKITGTGNITLYINNRSHVFKDIEDYIEIDSEMMNAYKGITLQNNKMYTTTFPKLVAGENNISWTGKVTSIEIIPRWIKL